MFSGVKTLVRYTKKPKTTFFLRHPLKAIRVARVRHDVKEALQPKRVAIGLGAAALAVPVGLWIGRKFGPSRMEHMEAPQATAA
jgi:hypothetical protein